MDKLRRMLTPLLFDLFLRPSRRVKREPERNQAFLTAQFSLFLTVFINTGVIYMSFFSTNPRVGLVLATAEGGFFLSYLLSRTRYFRFASLAVVIILSVIPLFNILLSSDRGQLAILTLLIWNTLTIIIAGFLLSPGLSRLFFFINILMIATFPLYVAGMTLSVIVLPLLFNIIIPLTATMLADHIRKQEKKQMEDILEVNRRLEKELNNKTVMERQLLYNATHDSLTKLPNLMILKNRIEHVMNYQRRHRENIYALLFLDLDRFKNINDTLGHRNGDFLLFEVGARLKESVREQDTVTRLGGDEFVILLEDVKGHSEVFPILQRLRDKISEPLELDDKTLHLSASVGVVMGREEYGDPEIIIRNADVAMNRAKKISGFSFEFFDNNMLDSVKSKLELESNLRLALEREEFLILYQPIIATGTEKTAGFEALIRWQDSKGNLVSPADFIPIAEETGLIIPMGYWIVEQVCAQVKSWQALHPDHSFSVSINLSNKQFQDSRLVESIGEIMEKHRVAPESLKFELTESLIVENSRETNEQLSRLREMGCQILIDDFGTGYSSLSYLHALPIDILKIDRSFINRISDKKEDIVYTIINLAHSLSMKVVAEGVETREQFELIRMMNCEMVQGYFFSKPVDPERAEKFLR